MEQSLQLLYEDLWGNLVRGAADSKHPYRYPTVGTLSADGPQLRTVVLRKVFPAERLVFFTDSRTPKVAQLRQQPQLAWHFYDPRKQRQIRIQSQAVLHQEDEVAKAFWEQVPLHSRKDYLSFQPPGTPLAQPNGSTDAYAIGPAHFCAVVGKVISIDYLELRREENHLRAIFQLQNGQVEGQWVVA